MKTTDYSNESLMYAKKVVDQTEEYIIRNCFRKTFEIFDIVVQAMDEGLLD